MLKDLLVAMAFTTLSVIFVATLTLFLIKAIKVLL
jgi:hypothetical protein